MLPDRSTGAAYAGRPSMCRNCGAIVAAGESACAQCGAPVSSEVLTARRFVPDMEAMRFARAIFSRPAIFTFIFLVANIFVFLLMTFSGGSENPAVLEAYGAKLNRLINSDRRVLFFHGEWWRFVTPIFLHIGLPHLLFNMYGLWVLGPYVERLYGSAKFVVFWVLTGIAGVVASYLSVVSPELEATNALTDFLFKSQDVPSAGASGALFGLIGVLFVFGLKFRHELPDGFKRAFGTGMLPTIALNVAIGFVIPGIDNAAHLGGLVAGAVLALFFNYKRLGRRGSVAYTWHALQVAAIALVVGSFALVWLNFHGTPPAFSRESASRALDMGGLRVRNYINAVGEGEKAFIQAFNDNDVSSIEGALTALDRAPKLDDTADALRNELKYLLVRVRRYAEEAPASGGPRRISAERRTEQANLAIAFGAWQQRFGLWVELDGEKYGLRPIAKPSTESRESRE